MLKKIIRLIRKRLVLGIIFVLSLTYCIVNVFRSVNISSTISSNEELDSLPQVLNSLQWQDGPLMDKNDSKILACRNSVQGKALIADVKGYVCFRSHVQSSGCCDINASSTKQYNCETCNPSGCCAIFEYCISCCMHPEKKTLLQKILGKSAAAFNGLYAAVTDQFELCLAKCRTSSQSVQHENTYKDPKAKHCYGEHPAGS